MIDKPNLTEDTWTGSEPLAAPKQSPARTVEAHSLPTAMQDRVRRRKTLLIRLGLYFAAVTFLSGFLLYLYMRFAPLPASDLTTHSRIVSADGALLADLLNNGQNRVRVDIREVPQDLQNATIAIEDAQFYQHSGLNLRGIARALYVNLKNRELIEGGSSITQQLAKVMYLSHDRTWSRKFREMLLTIQLETRYSKQEILELYLNAVYYGHGANGVGTAAKIYFNKSATDLNLAESALLAGIPKGPTFFSPFSDQNKAKERQQQVLQAMVRHGYITQEQADAAYKQNLHFAEKKDIQNGAAPYFTRYATWSAINLHGVPEEELYRSGLTLQTTLDLHMQKAAEAAIQKHLPQVPGLQAALVALDPKTGHIKAMVGGRDFSQSSFNRVLATRQPGSSFKPFVYLSALENGASPVRMVKSEPTTFNYEKDKYYEVKNFNDQYAYDYITMREAIRKSDNVYAVATIMEITPQQVIETARRFGIESELKPYPSLALGVFPVSPLEMAKAYAALANGGTLLEPTAIRQVVNAYGREIYHRERASQQAANPQNVFILTDLMKSVFEPGGTAARVAPSVANRVVAGKTGTTDTDAWMAGYSPNLVAVVWVGYDKNHLLNTRESYAAAQIWGEFMKTALENTPASDFERPEGLLELTIDPTTGMLATPNCPQVQREFFRIGTEPTDECTEHPASGFNLDILNPEQGKSGIKKFWKWFRGGTD
ncbi:transglycosylase domain-containing protein [Effusibacillus lacus]|uniref:Carboxypeptidase n=1 Tax=Effusibacillus lacus TaxID=1348429 RepID=A0A292YM07_9BACL|nr:PBP1A family penicillin-binding protein [Effusibacillus lacus]TCS70516.1 1A family penicillin-binding protein [Effusibacillus lacus]GAX89535.1 carboxypeptidase [Effusibacillus lacus]